GAGWFLSSAALARKRQAALDLQRQGLDSPAIRDRLFPGLPRGAAEGFLAALALPAAAPASAALEGEVEALYRRAGLQAPEDGAAEEAFPGRVREMKLARRALTDRGTLVVIAKGFR